jgi:hypothetical protein
VRAGRTRGSAERRRASAVRQRTAGVRRPSRSPTDTALPRMRSPIASGDFHHSSSVRTLESRSPFSHGETHDGNVTGLHRPLARVRVG